MFEYLNIKELVAFSLLQRLKRYQEYKMSGAAGKRHQSGRPSTRQVLMSALVDLLNKPDSPALSPTELEEMDMELKVQKVIDVLLEVNDKFAAVHNIINEASDGIDPRLVDCEERISRFAEENKQLKADLELVKGLFIKSEEENTWL